MKMFKKIASYFSEEQMIRRHLYLFLMLMVFVAFSVWQLYASVFDTGRFVTVNFFIAGFALLLMLLMLRKAEKRNEALNSKLTNLKIQYDSIYEEYRKAQRELASHNSRTEIDDSNHAKGVRLINILKNHKKQKSDNCSFGKIFLSALASEFELCCGAVFIKEKHSGKFCVEGRYAIDDDVEIECVAEGEGLAGQVIKDGKAISLDNVPASYIKANSGLGASSTVFVYILPLFCEEEVAGIIEIGSFKELPIITIWDDLKDDLSSLVSK